jgi:uncharacterized protein (DUF427 family)
LTLTIGTGPLAGSPGGAFNFDFALRSPQAETSGRGYVEAPKHRIFYADFPRRLRAVIGGRVLFDTEGAKLLYETGILPVAYIPLEDFDQSLLERTDHVTHCPFKGDASYWTLTVGDRVEENVVWGYRDPLPDAPWLKGYAAVYYKRMDGWFVEDEPVFGHLRDPYHRVDVHDSSRPVTVTVAGQVVARSQRPKLLFETGLPLRVYIPRADVSPALLTESETRTVCAYKGQSTYWSLPDHPDVAWSYEAPLPEAVKIAGHVSFSGDGVEVDLGAPTSPSRPGGPAADR